MNMLKKMNSHSCLLFFIVIFFGKINALPRYRYRRQINLVHSDDSSNKELSARQNTPSGSIVGTYYYGVGADPNYGSFISRPNSPDGGGGILPISYDPNSNLNGYLINSNNHQQQNYLYNNNNNAWQRPNTNNYYNHPGNRYAPGSPGWYATGGNYWYNNGQSIIVYPYLLIINILSLIICK